MKSAAAALLLFVTIPVFAWPFDDAADRYQAVTNNFMDCYRRWIFDEGSDGSTASGLAARKKLLDQEARGTAPRFEDKYARMSYLAGEGLKVLRESYCRDELLAVKQARLECTKDGFTADQCRAAFELGGGGDTANFLIDG